LFHPGRESHPSGCSRLSEKKRRMMT